VTCARAHCLLASTYDRIGDTHKSQASAAAGVRLLEPGDDPLWHVEHLMVLGLFTSYRRRGPVDFTTFEESLRLARALDDPVLLLAVLNNFAWIALEADWPRAIALADEMRAVIATRLDGVAASAPLDTIAHALLGAGRLLEADTVAEAAVARARLDHVEPDVLAASLLTAAEILRARGDRAGARERLDEAWAEAEDRTLRDVGARVLKALSEMAAEDGDFEAAYRYLLRHKTESDRFQTERSERHAAMIQAIYGAELERERRIAMERLADTDPLTGLWNRRYLDRRLRELSAAGRPVAVALVDVDHFKQVNDAFSHDAGDRALCRIAALARLHVAGDEDGEGFVARLGGEEFALVLPVGDGEVARRRCEALRAHVEADDWDLIAPGARITVSIGLALGSGGEAPSVLLARADARLYEAKRAGRDRVVSDVSAS
jgi:diguanylate cyclase (GGDEF)-like protein